MGTQREIIVRGAREHNLQDVDVRLPRGALTTVTGVSGSGKSSLAHDTLFKEGQRRFVESLSAYARQFLGQAEKPRVDHVEGLSPTVSVDQKTVNRNPRSTVGTITEVTDHLRLLLARLGIPHCPECGKSITAQTPDQVVDRVQARHAGATVMVLAPIVHDRKGEYRKELEELRSKGYVRARIDGEVRRLDEPIKLGRYERHTIEVILDRIKVSEEKRGRLTEGVEQGFRLGGGQCSVLVGAEQEVFSSSLACRTCGVDVVELEPRLFSFNSPHGACPRCDGLGTGRDVDPGLIVPDEDLSIDEGAVLPSAKGGFALRRWMRSEILDQVCDALKVPRDRPWRKLSDRQREAVLQGRPGKRVSLELSYEGKRLKYRKTERRIWKGVIPIIRERYELNRAKSLERFMSPASCPDCGGARLRPEARAVRFRDQSIVELSAFTVEELLAFVRGVQLEGAEATIGGRLIQELAVRLEFLERVGLGYLTVDRSAATLSGGESQRIRLATQVGSRLRGVLYVLDEPSIGLHQRDNRRLIETLEELRDAGNTVLVVEHDEETIEASDWVVDVGPGAGANGGHLVAEGTPSAVRRNRASVTGAFLSGREEITVPSARRKETGHRIIVKQARAHNLKAIDVPFPLGLFTCVTGVSGSGKSTLIDLVLKRALARRFHNAEDVPGAHDRITGLQHLDKVIEINQSPIGRTPRSNPGTYTKVFDQIRDLYASLPEAKVRGYAKGRFSFNVKGGRCEECQGAGMKVVEMQFLADVSVPCEVCQSRRFNPETLEIRYRGKSINDVLEMAVDEALEFFANHPKIKRTLATLERVGLGYMRLGQPSTTLSGGEAQRVKLASQLHRPPTGRTLYLLDEPTTGLHFLDIRRLLAALQALVDAGNTVVVVEHNLDVVKCADWIIDLGPEGGAGGGELVYAGPFSGVLEEKRSHTGRVLRELLGPKSRRVARRRKKPRDRALDGDIHIRGASMHNLQSVDARFPAGELSVVTGPSGSGKTSLAFDTLFAEGQRRFVECLSTYARQFLGRLERPPVDSIQGLAPAIAIDQKSSGRNPRSTVATTTEIQDHLRLLYARLGTPHCPTCGKRAEGFPPDRAWKHLRKLFPDCKGRLLAPLWVKGLDHGTLLKKPVQLKVLARELVDDGFRRVLVDGEEVRLDGKLPALSRVGEVWLVVDRVQLKSSSRTRVLDSVELAFERGYGLCAFEDLDGERVMLSELPGCPEHGFLLEEELTPRMFSFNSHVGACESCHGLGVTMTCDPDRLVIHPEKPLFRGALVPRPGDFLSRGSGYWRQAISSICKVLGADMREPFQDLPAAARKAILWGFDEEVVLRKSSRRKNRSARWEMKVTFKGLCRYIEEWHRTSSNDWWLDQLDPLMSQDVCPECKGDRLKPAFRAVTVGGETPGAVGRMTVTEALSFVKGLEFRGADRDVADQILQELKNRLGFLEAVGLDYLSLSRSAVTLSGGEAQRIRLATQIGNRLTGVIYVLDEPTIGLHQRDTDRLLGTLKELRDFGNTVIVVEHDRETIDAADWIVDLGPGAGQHGGHVVFQGTRKELDRAVTLTADYVAGRRGIDSHVRERRPGSGSIVLEKATRNNLADLTVAFPRGALVCVTGVSGSGKSTLVMDTLGPAVESHIDGPRRSFPGLGGLKGASAFTACVRVDQSAIGTSPRSNPASYIGVLDQIRKIMATATLAKIRGYGPGRFSFNTAVGRCAGCEGRGSIKVEMHFLPDVWVVCDECRGRRFDRETLAVEYRGKNVADVLEMEVSEALTFFHNHRRVARSLGLLHDVGLGYMSLGQAATTLSGGEAQRIKLARELGRRVKGQVLYLLDEPTTGLHFDDVAKLVQVLHRLVDQGHTVIVIEHNLDVISSADHVIDLGPGGGDGGGRLVVQGTPEEVAAQRSSWTGQFLSRQLNGAVRNPRRGKKLSEAAR